MDVRIFADLEKTDIIVMKCVNRRIASQVTCESDQCTCFLKENRAGKKNVKTNLLYRTTPMID